MMTDLLSLFSQDKSSQGLGSTSGRIIFQAAARVRKNIGDLNDQGLVSLAKLLAKFDWPETRLLE